MDTTTLFSLAGRTALVTGGSRGIGRMIAAGFIAQGARVYVSSRKREACMEVAEELGPQCIALAQDVSTVAGCRALAAAYAGREPALDILVNNAGAAWGAPFESFPEAGWDKVMDLNLKSPFFLTQALHGALRAAASAQRPAKVINIASVDGMRPNPWDTYSYQASKAGLIHLTRRLAARLITRPHRGQRDRAGRLCLGHEPRGARPWRYRGAGDTGGAHRQGRGHGGRGDLPGEPRRGLRGRRDADRRRRAGERGARGVDRRLERGAQRRAAVDLRRAAVAPAQRKTFSRA